MGSSSSGEGLSEARLREIRKGIEVGQMDMDEDEAFWAIRDLLAEVERLRAREAALVAVVRAVGEEDHEYPDMTPGQTRYLCPFCPGNDAATRMAFVHARWCPVTQARALLASTEQEGGGDGA